MKHLRLASVSLAPCLSFFLVSGTSVKGASWHDFSRATVVTPARLEKVERTAVRVLLEEVEKRTTIRLPTSSEWPADGSPVIVVGPRGRAREFGGPYQESRELSQLEPEGYRLLTGTAPEGTPVVWVLGNDRRGVLFGVGKLLRCMRLSREQILVPDLDLDTAPVYPLRGHQIGYRPKTNSYDAFTPEMWEQYLRDMAVFGTNAAELIPPRSDDAPDSPHFPLPQLEMMARVSALMDSYDMDVWIWYPALDEDYSDPATVEAALQEWAQVFARLPRIDAVFVPGGDPGHTPPQHLLPFLEKQTANLRQFHPDAEMWLSPQGFTTEWMEYLFDYLDKKRPKWLKGIVYGPWLRFSIPKLRERLPKDYPIRRYPDITHSLRCQYPVPGWDLAYALTEAREVINPRPVDQATIFRAFDEYTIGFITYSEGVNDDVNKFIWSSLGWDPATDITEILREYARYFIGPKYEDSFSKGLLALERNWRGPLLSNHGVDVTLQQFQQMEREATPAVLLNWRFQQALYRAYYDAYVRKRLLYETQLEEKALDYLRRAPEMGSITAIEAARQVLQKADLEKPAQDLRRRIFQLAEALYQSIRMQLSVNLYQAISVGRGANLDTLDTPLNSRQWYFNQFERILSLDDEKQRLAELSKLVNWSNPGPGGFYDDLGKVHWQPHLVEEKSYAEDPSFLEHPQVSFVCQPGWRLSWCDHADNLYDYVLKLRYSGLDPERTYKIRLVYAGDFRYKIRLVADEAFEIHPFMEKPKPVQPVEFEVPIEATADGTVEFRCYVDPARGGSGRGCQISEVWLFPTD